MVLFGITGVGSATGPGWCKANVLDKRTFAYSLATTTLYYNTKLEAS